ncbi:MAG: hypothetical protein J0M00_01540 [Burkholderiales bacterium]|nr:hypothetical protein [Burkholderiales bacterium]
MDFKARDHVQLRVRGETLCGVVRGDYERWISGSGVRVSVKTSIGDFRVRPFDLRKCSSVGDGRCACVDGARSAPAALARASGVPPLGNTGVAA